MAELATVESLRDFLGVDEASDPIITRMRSTALARLKRATGVDWAEREDADPVADEAVHTMVWLSFYAVRGEADNASFLREHLTGLILTLQYGKEGAHGDHQQSNPAAP